MAGGYHHAALASELADGVRHFGRWASVVEEIDLDAVGREYVGGELGKLARVVAHVESYHHAYLRQLLEAVVEIVGETLGG